MVLKGHTAGRAKKKKKITVANSESMMLWRKLPHVLYEKEQSTAMDGPWQRASLEAEGRY